MRPNPHVVLGAAVAAVLGAEYLREVVEAAPWFPLQVAVAGAALVVVLPRCDELRLAPLMAIALGFHVGWVLVRLNAAYQSPEQLVVYAPYGEALLDGVYPRAEYPVAAVLLFALEAALGGGESYVVHALAMVPFQLAVVASIWSLRLRWSPWLAAVVAVWPVNAWFWEFRFDLAPTALLAVGVALGWRTRWALAGAVLGLGFAMKWTPGLAVVTVGAYLLGARDLRSALRLGLGAAAVVVLVHGSFLAWSPSEVWAAYSIQGSRGISNEAVWHLPLRTLGLEGRPDAALAEGVEAPAWADVTAALVQAAVLVAVFWIAARAATLRGALALAVMMPVAFLMTNRIFSVQWFTLLFVAWLLAVALIVETRREAVLLTMVACAATLANAFIIPVPLEGLSWELMSAARFALGLSLTAWLIVRAARLTDDPEPAPRAASVPGAPRPSR